MSIHVALNHKTCYDYDQPVTVSPQIIRLRPAPHARTPVLSYSLNIKPKDYFINWQQDPHGNWLARVVFPNKIRQFHVEVDLVAEIAVHNPFDFFVEEYAEKIGFEYEATLKKDLKPFLGKVAMGPLFNDFLGSLDRSQKTNVDFVVQLNQQLQTHINYLIRMEPGVQTPEFTLKNHSGSCRDSAWLLVNILRHLGMAARFVSGYLIQLKPDVKSLDGPSGTDKDFTDLHAWAEVFIPGAGWIGLDPTSGLLAGEGHIPLVASPEPATAAPITGAVDECEVTFSHHMAIERIKESPRVTKPYRSSQWECIDKLGEQVEADLQAGDVRLTMGGEPTFVSIDDMEGDEWNTAAVGPTKQKLAEQLIMRMKERFAPDGFVMFTQGKWYPGESLPRWAYHLYWRNDQVPINLDLPSGKQKKVTVQDAKQLMAAVAKLLEVNADNIVPAYEDPWLYLKKEHSLPANVDPMDNKLDNLEERRRLQKIFTEGLGKPCGYILPVQQWKSRADEGWISERWEFRSGYLLLIPGDSNIGLRLPLDTLPWIAKSEYPYIVERDPSEPRSSIPDFAKKYQGEFVEHDANASDQIIEELPEEQQAQTKSDEDGYVRTALCIEPRGDKLSVFMPPVEAVEHFLDLQAAIYQAANALSIPIQIEGYPPPDDPRVNVIKITPDPGVIEVNIHPAKSWGDLRENTLALYEEARLTRLGTEKFMVDGRHVGTGGGNHIVVGGATPEDSPFLRRPDVLASLLRYWQNHPSLSYLFSGLFIGPTSQAPRIDEARIESLYELEIALTQIPEKGTEAAPWRIDRALRHILADVTGNTHRTEFCIDKLYSPDSATGRLGLLELRSFEMPPHAEMSLVQQLLVRSLIARFWQVPYERPLVHWGTELHDRFMLPHFIKQDLSDVVTDLREHGYDFDESWFEPHMEFRFPYYGSVFYRDMELELRNALEPWHVLGEEPSAGGTVRFVDSSLERVQIKVRNFLDDRYHVLCNGRKVPLQHTTIANEYVAGVRFRAWQPSTCLHPTIPVQAPLTIDIFDSWTNRVVSGCTYHVGHPGGRNYESPPINANEAESRRLARFSAMGHTPKQHEVKPESVNPLFPMTLDLRWQLA